MNLVLEVLVIAAVITATLICNECPYPDLQRAPGIGIDLTLACGYVSRTGKISSLFVMADKTQNSIDDSHDGTIHNVARSTDLRNALMR